MCGIVGVYIFNNKEFINSDSLKKAIDSIHHRGPDANGIKIAKKKLAFGHVRLSIIDLSPESNQPFVYENLMITFNGEIFNYIEIKEELKLKGYQFRTESDTEVVLVSYLEWGEECVQRFNGMWAFAIYDKSKDKLFCSRDRFGIKPFNYYKSDNSFIFASEIKAILAYDNKLKKVNYNAISRYCRETVGAQAEETWFENILRLKPAHNITVENNIFKMYRYWDYPSQSEEIKDKLAVEEEYYKLLKDAVDLRFRSDVPVGLTLSGGLDSTSISYLSRENRDTKINAYTASFPNQPFNEYKIAKEVCDELGVNSVEVLPNYQNYISSLKDLIYHLESGHGSPAIFPLNAIAERAKEDVTVYLEGQGADELMGGYYENLVIIYVINNLINFKFREAFKTLKLLYNRSKLKLSIMLYFRQTLSPYFRYLFRKFSKMESIYGAKLKKHKAYQFKLNKRNKKWSRLTQLLAIQHQTGLVNLLHYGDAISMKHSLENRLPFMDYKLVEFIFKLDDSYKLNSLFGKVIHRDVFKNILPEKIINDKNKLGFISPLKQIFIDEKFGAVSILKDSKFYARELFKEDEINRLLEEHQKGKRNHERILFKILSVELWFQNFIDESNKLNL